MWAQRHTQGRCDDGGRHGRDAAAGQGMPEAPEKS